MNVLGIETTCDETAAALVIDGEKIVTNVIASQAEMHSPFGGVFPEMACRRHLEDILPVIEKALNGVKPDLIAVAEKPGLIGALILGINAAKALSYAWNVPFVGVNHIEAHLYAAIMSGGVEFPAIGMIVSGGHTSLVLVKGIGVYEEIGCTVDDAIGEAFDKVAQMLGLPYPGGPEVEKLAKTGDPKAFNLCAGKVKGKPFHFSFSGLKTQVLYALKGPNSNKHSPTIINDDQKKDLAASFQLVALEDIIYKGIRAAEKFGCRHLLFGGGVSSNSLLRDLLGRHAPPTFQIHFPRRDLCLDNGAMIAGLGYHVYRASGPSKYDLIPRPKSALKSFL